MDDHEEKLTKLLNLYVELVHNKFNRLLSLLHNTADNTGDTITVQSPDLVTSHLTELVHHCLRTSQQAPNIRTRILALSVLSHCATMEGATTVQLATTVTRDLRRVVSDKKRLVRLEAAKTRNKWFLVTQPS